MLASWETTSGVYLKVVSRKRDNCTALYLAWQVSLALQVFHVTNQSTMMLSTDEIGALESVKAASEIYSPVTGKVKAKNTAVEESPAIINSSPYDDGEMFVQSLWSHCSCFCWEPVTVLPCFVPYLNISYVIIQVMIQSKLI